MSGSTATLCCLLPLSSSFDHSFNLFFFFKNRNFFGLGGWDDFSSWLTLHSPKKAKSVPGQTQEPGLQAKAPMGGVGTQSLEPLLLPPRVSCILQEAGVLESN